MSHKDGEEGEGGPIALGSSSVAQSRDVVQLCLF